MRGAAALTVLVLAMPTLAYLPDAPRIANAVAEMNRGARRTEALAIEVELRMGDAPDVVAAGTLLSDPEGVARIELRSGKGTVERHLMRGTSLRATRQGDPIERPRPFLPPLFLLQVGTGGELQSELAALGAKPGEIALGHEGPSNCFVLGGRGRGEDAREPRASLWVDRVTLETVRIDLPDGASFRLGPPAPFDGVRLPAWIDLHVGAERVGRLTVKGASSARVTVDTFQPAWLETRPALPAAPAPTPTP